MKMKFLIYFSLICSLTALPVNQNDLNAKSHQINHPYHSGLIKDYNSNQKFEYKFTELHATPSSPNEHQFLPLTYHNDQFDNQFSVNKHLSEEKSKFNDESLDLLDNNKKLNTQLNAKYSSSEKVHRSPSAVLSDLFTRVNKRYMNSNYKRKDKLRSSVRKQDHRILHDYLEQQEVCPESSFSNVELDPVSKAYLAPILFSGKLSSLSEDYAGRVAATFQVLRVIKTSTVEVKDQFGQTQKVPIHLEKGHQVVLYFVSKPGQRFIPPYCAAFMNSSSIGSLRLEQKYIVYAAAPVQSLQEMHHHSFGSVSYKAIKEEIVNSSDLNNQMDNGLNDNFVNESMISNLSNESSTEVTTNQTVSQTISQINKTRSSVKTQNLVWMNDQHYQLPSKQSPATDQPQIPMQFIVHYLSAFYTPEPFSKNISRSIAKTLCKKCAKKPQVEGYTTGDVRVQAKNKLRLRCKISGNPQPWIDWYRNGKKLRNKGRVSIKTTKKYSRLDINRVESSDSGYYECRVQNVAVKQPVVAKTRVIVVLNQRKTTKPPTESTTTTTAANLWPLIGAPCPINNFCLNGGVCTFFENVFEYVCQCAPGYRGLRCQEKDISLNEPIKSVLEFNSALKT